MARIVADQGSASCPQSRTLADLLDEMAARQPAREFIVGGATRLTYAEARARVRRLAKGLHQLGVRRGDKVALLMDNRAEWLLIDFAVTLLGATLVPISTWSRPRELGYVLSHCDATTFITVDRFMGNDYLAMLAEVGEPGSSRLPLLRRVVSVGAARASSGAARLSLPAPQAVSPPCAARGARRSPSTTSGTSAPASPMRPSTHASAR